VTPTEIQRKIEIISFPTPEDRTQSEVALFGGGRHPEHDLYKYHRKNRNDIKQI
jgi:hypothetical protein